LVKLEVDHFRSVPTIPSTQIKSAIVDSEDLKKA
jgi:hypothetical protein